MRCIIICNMHLVENTHKHHITADTMYLHYKITKKVITGVVGFDFFASTSGNRHHISIVLGGTVNRQCDASCITRPSINHLYLFMCRKYEKWATVGRMLKLHSIRVNLRKFVQSTPFESNWLKLFTVLTEQQRKSICDTLTNIKRKTPLAKSFQFNQ